MSCDIPTLTDVLQSGDPEQAQRTLESCTAMIFDPTLWLWTIAFTVVGGVGGWLIGRYKHAVVRDTLLGLAFGPLGWIVSLFMPAQKPSSKCAACGNTVDARDKHCRHCGAAL
jgi:hypothetical protein